MGNEPFTLKNREEVSKFEMVLQSYCSKYKCELPHISLENAHDFLQHSEHGGRIFSALLDIKLNFIIVLQDMHEAGAIWNNNFSKDKIKEVSILDIKELFIAKMEIHRFNSNFILRYRAVWDKIMGLLILLLSPEKYDSFCKSKSKKKSFKKITLESKSLSEEFITNILKSLENFDNKFRTAEAHGTGSLRKWSFNMDEMSESPLLELLGYWNLLNDTIHTIGKLFISIASDEQHEIL